MSDIESGSLRPSSISRDKSATDDPVGRGKARRTPPVAAVLLALAAAAGTGSAGDLAAQVAEPPRVHARDVGIAPGIFRPGPLNAITDVGDVRVTCPTRIEGADVRTGVTVILPHGGNLFQDKVPANLPKPLATTTPAGTLS